MSEDKRSILVIGNAHSVWIKNFVSYILCDGERRIAVFDTGNPDGGDEAFYQALQVRIIRFPEGYKKGQSVIEKIIANIRDCFFLRHICDDYSYINLQYVDISFYRRLFYSRRINQKLILSFWGSDLLRRSKRSIKVLGGLLRFVGCRQVTFDNGDLQNVFKEALKSHSGDGVVAMLPLPGLDAIDNTRNETIGRVDGIAFPANRELIAVGYNGGEAQQHLKIIKTLGMLKEDTKKGITVLLQMTYGGSEEYIKKCEASCRGNRLDYIIFRNFLSDMEIGRLRNSVNVFINAQTTDAFSGSFCEYLYADTVVFNAKWLRYDEMDRYGLSCIEFDDFASLGSLLDDYFSHPYAYPINHERNRAVIHDLRSISSCKKKWDTIFTD